MNIGRLADYRPDLEGSSGPAGRHLDPWERNNNREVQALVNKFRSFTEERRHDSRRSNLTLPASRWGATQPWAVPQPWSAPQPWDRHAGLYSPDCTVTYSQSPHFPPSTSAPGRETVTKPRYHSGSRSPIFDDERRWSPVQPEDREVCNIVYGRDGWHGERSPLHSRLGSPFGNRHGDRSPPYPRLESPIGGRPGDRSPPYPRLASPFGGRHGERSLTYSSRPQSPTGGRHGERSPPYPRLESPFEGRHGGRSPPFHRPESSFGGRYGERNPLYPRPESPVGGRHGERNPLYPRPESPVGGRHGERNPLFPRSDSPVGGRYRERNPLYPRPESPVGGRREERNPLYPRSESPVGGRLGDRNPLYPSSESPVGGRHGERNPLYPRTESPVGGRHGERNPLYPRLESPVGGRHGERNPLYSRQESPFGGRHGERNPLYPRSESPVGGRHGERNPLYPRRESPFGGRLRERSPPYPRRESPTGCRHVDSHIVTSPTPWSRHHPRENDAGRLESGSSQLDFLKGMFRTTERKRSVSREKTEWERLPAKRSNKSPILSPPPPPVFSISSSSTYRPTDYSKPLPFKSSASIEMDSIEKSLNLLGRLKRKQEILSKCELKIGELYRKRSKLANAPSLFYPMVKNSKLQESYISPVMFAHKVALTFNGCMSKSDIEMLILSKDSEEGQRVSVSPLKEHKQSSSVDKQESFSQIQKPLEPSHHSSGRQYCEDSSTSSSRILSNPSHTHRSGEENLKDYHLEKPPNKDRKALNPILEMAYGPMRSSNFREVANIEPPPPPSMDYFPKLDQQRPPWEEPRSLGIGAGWPKYRKEVSPPRPPYHQTTIPYHTNQSSLVSSPNTFPPEITSMHPVHRPQTKSQITLNLLPRADSYSSHSMFPSEDQAYVARVEQFLAKVQGPGAERQEKIGRPGKNVSVVLSSDEDNDDVIYVGELGRYASSRDNSKRRLKSSRHLSPPRNRAPPGERIYIRPPGTSPPSSTEPPAKKFHHEFQQEQRMNNIMVTAAPQSNLMLVVGKTGKIKKGKNAYSSDIPQPVLGKDSVANQVLVKKIGTPLEKPLSDISETPSEQKTVKVNSSKKTVDSCETPQEEINIEIKKLDKNLESSKSETSESIAPKEKNKLSDIDNVFTEGNLVARDIKEIQHRDVRLKKVFFNTQRNRTINKNLCIKNEMLCLDNERTGPRIVASSVENEMIFYIHCLAEHVNDKLSSILRKYFTPIKDLSVKIESALKSCEECSKFKDPGTNAALLMNSRDTRTVVSDKTLGQHQANQHSNSTSDLSLPARKHLIETPKHPEISYTSSSDITSETVPEVAGTSTQSTIHTNQESNEQKAESNKIPSMPVISHQLVVDPVPLTMQMDAAESPQKSVVESLECSVKPNRPSEENLFLIEEFSEPNQNQKIEQKSLTPSERDHLQRRPPILAPGEVDAAQSEPPTEDNNPIALVKEIQSTSAHVSNIVSRINDPECKSLYFLKNNLLLKRCTLEGKSLLKILIPNDKVEEVVGVVHTKFSNHGSYSNVVSILKKHFSPAPNFTNIINRAIKLCPVCRNKQ